MAEPNYPIYARPEFKLGPVIDTANRFALAQRQMASEDQLYNIRAQQSPLETARMQQQVESETRANTIGAATQDQTIAADNATLADKIVQAKKGMGESEWQQAVLRNQIMSKVSEYVLAHPGDPRVVTDAERVINESGVVPSDQVTAWKAEAGDPMKLAAMADSYKTFLNVAVSTGGTSYAKVPENQKQSLDTEAYHEAKTLSGGTREPTAAEMEMARQDIYARHGITGAPVAAPQPAEAQPASTGWDPNVSGALKGAWNATGGAAVNWLDKAGGPEATPIFGGGGGPAPAAAAPPPAAPAPEGHPVDLRTWLDPAPSPEIGMPGAAATSGEAGTEAPKPAGKTRGIERGGSVAEDQAKWTKMIQGTDAQGAPVPVATFTGDPNNEAAVKKWVNSLPDKAMFMAPGRPELGQQQKHSNFK